MLAYGTGLTKAESTARFPSLPFSTCLLTSRSMEGVRVLFLAIATGIAGAIFKM